MRCPKCQKESLVEEQLSPAAKRVSCRSCGFFEHRDARDLPLLQEVPSYRSAVLES